MGSLITKYLEALQTIHTVLLLMGEKWKNSGEEACASISLFLSILPLYKDTEH